MSGTLRAPGGAGSADGGGGVLVAARGLAKFFGSRLVLRKLDLEARAGEALLVVGCNGAGKTTLLKLLAGLARPSAGTIALHVEPERVAYLGHATFLYPRLSAEANLLFWGRMYGLSPSREALAGVLERVGLGHAGRQPAGTFSRGMAQRLNLARVFLVDPRLVFLDEPGTGLDPASQELLRTQIATLKRAGAAVVWVSHHLAADLPCAERVLHLQNGRAAYYGPAKEFPATFGGQGC